MSLNYKNDNDFDAQSYIPVNQRLREFWDKYENGAVVTEHAFYEGALIMKAQIYADKNDALPIGTGHAFLESLNGEKVGEATETTAIGRALAAAGFKIEKSMASAEEMKRFDSKKKNKDLKAAIKTAETNNKALKQAIKEHNDNVSDGSEFVNDKGYTMDTRPTSEAVPQVPTKLKTSNGFNLNKIRKDSQQ